MEYLAKAESGKLVACAVISVFLRDAEGASDAKGVEKDLSPSGQHVDGKVSDAVEGV